MLERQKNLPDDYVKTASLAIQEQIFSSNLYINADKIFTYISTPKEPSTLEIIETEFMFLSA